MNQAAHRLAGKSVALAADFAGRRRGEMRRAAQRIGVAIALQETAPRRRRLRRIDVEFRRQFGIARLQRRVHEVAGEHRVVLAAAEGEGDMAGRMARRRQDAHVIADREIVAARSRRAWPRPPAARCRRTAAPRLWRSARSSSRIRSCRTRSAPSGKVGTQRPFSSRVFQPT